MDIVTWLLTVPCAQMFGRRCTNRVVEKGPTARLEIFRIAGSPKTGNTWGVKTLDFIRANSFVCEVTGQYVTGHTADGAGTVADTILSGASKSAGKEVACVIPVAAWDAAQPDGFSPVAWAAGEVDSKRRGEDEPAPNGPVSRPLTLRELQKDKERYEAVRGFLQGQICVRKNAFTSHVGVVSVAYPVRCWRFRSMHRLTPAYLATSGHLYVAENEFRLPQLRPPHPHPHPAGYHKDILCLRHCCCGGWCTQIRMIQIPA